MSEETTFKVIVRYLNKQGITVGDGSFSVNDVNVFISQWLNKGYVVKDTHYIGDNPQGYGLMIILVKESALMGKAKKVSLED